MIINTDGPQDTKAGDGEPADTLPHIKRVSRIKHAILERYLPAWSLILGSSNQRLCYFDCYAGRGEYELQGQRVEGSALLAVRAAKEYVSMKHGRMMTVLLIEKDTKEARALETYLARFQPFPTGLRVHVLPADSQTLVEEMLGQVNQLAPSFFMI